jgi:uncharacterized membrane protein
MKKHYQCILMIFCAVLLFGLAAPQLSMAGVPATQLPLGGFPMGGALCVNNTGQCAGYLRDNETVWHACFWDFGTLTPTLLDQADGVLDDLTETSGDYINSSGQVAGTGYYDTGAEGEWYQRGFSWTQAGGMTDIGTLLDGDGWTEPVGINDSGQVLAYSEDNDFTRNFLWTAGTRAELTYTDNGQVYPIDTRFGALNNSGKVAGILADPDLTIDPAVLWDNGTTTILTPPGVSISNLVYINNSDQVAGYRHNGENPWIYTPGDGFRYINVTGNYPDMSNNYTIYVSDINDQGQVLICQSYPAFRVIIWEDDGSQDGLFTDVPVSCLTKPDTYNLDGYLLNEQGQVIGSEGNSGYVRKRFFFWDPATPDGMAVLALPASTAKAEVSGLNDAGLAVGYSYDASFTTVLPCMWQTDGIAMTYPPVIDVSSAPATGLVGSNISFTATATDPDAGDTLAFSLDPGAPAGAAIDPATGDFSWTPAAAGQFTFTVRVTDSEDLCDTATVTIGVAMPSALPLTVQSVERKGQSVVVLVLIENPTAADVTDVIVTASSLGGVNTASRLPDTFRSIRAGTSKTCRLKFATEAVPAGEASFIVNGTCSLGGFNKTETVTVP